MIELLSLPRRPKRNICIPNIKVQSGLPINSLPGWEHIPLNSKLPMLKCPGNQVIFSKNKIGRSLKHLKHEFDSSGHDRFPEYNPLHDSNLKTYYTNETNLKRLRENGEITLNNDVICNLKDFNEFRQQLHKSNLYYILQEINRMEAEQIDRLLIANAECITNRDHHNLSAREHTYSKILHRKCCLDQQRAERYKILNERTFEKLAYIQMIQTIKQTAVQHRKSLRQLKFQKYADVRNDLQRKQLISLKKLFQFKKDRLQKNLHRLYESRQLQEQEKQRKSWNKRLAERIANQEKVERLLIQAQLKRNHFMENHKQKYKKMWSKIQQEIKNKALKNHMKIYNSRKKQTEQNESKKTFPKPPFTYSSLCTEFQENFENLLDSEVCKALNAALDMEDHVKVPFEPDDPIYKAAQFITQHILTKFHKDLSADKMAFTSVYDRMDKFFEEAKNFVIFRATQIIASFQDPEKHLGSQLFRRGSVGRVSFSKIPSTIGMSSYQIHPLIEVKDVSNRKPTPAGSLTSVVVDSTTSLVQKTNCSNLCRNELVFIEHYVTKFKRELIVGMGSRVFAAIQCHFEQKVMDVRQELLDIDRNFLLNQVTKSILSYAVNPLNLEAILKLCISTLAGDIIWNLQNQFLKPRRVCTRVAQPCVYNLKY
ncbi:fibrous sheath-interacting protein 2 [Lucilia cuprina]|uniref:fibrous sheath-interacting protein 2 n=1 Tax=Lucilia cuprina TaxID=7375 RepID=UPI001F05F404|nr:fibrous sheath-interacting protein 2 [Lucilia cuprina]